MMNLYRYYERLAKERQDEICELIMRNCRLEDELKEAQQQHPLATVSDSELLAKCCRRSLPRPTALTSTMAQEARK